MPRKGRRWPVAADRCPRVATSGCLLFAVALGLGVAARPAFCALRVAAPTGLAATIHPADEVTRLWVTRVDGKVWFHHPVHGDVELLTGPDDPRLPRRADGSFVPLSPDAVAAAVRGLAGVTPMLAVELFLLPSPPVETLGSFARRDAILLSPGFGAVDPTTVAALVTHELGHVLAWAYLDPRPGRWTGYRALRGLDAQRNGALASHAWREREILAEDVRYLFGGSSARVGQALENEALPLPDAVSGLRDSLSQWLAGAPPAPVTTSARAFPNPSRGPVMVEVPWNGPDEAGTAALTDAAGVLAQSVLDVFDLRGRHVRHVPGGIVQNARLMFAWDGRDASGRAVAAGWYACAVTWPGGVARGRVLVIH